MRIAEPVRDRASRCAFPPLQPTSHVAIIGGGFSGTLQAINLLRHEGPRATLIERARDQLARGVAYSAAHPSHLLNVRAANMSALPDEPDHFVEWLVSRGGGGPDTFVSRRIYGAYLAELLKQSHIAAPGRLTIRTGEAVDIAANDDAMVIRMADGPKINADVVVLAIGNLPPHPPAHVDPDALGPDLYAADPWAADIADGLTGADEVLLIGTGLTAVDAALLLEAKGFRGRIHALSRRGLTPRVHDPLIARPGGNKERPSGTMSSLTRSVRRRADGVDWRIAVDELRPQTQRIWQAMDNAGRTRFVRHLRPFWDVHRHRLAPDVVARIDALRMADRLEIIAGKIEHARRTLARSIQIDYRPRGTDRLAQLTVRRIVNCTGPQGDVTRSEQPIIAQLRARGLIRPDALRLGIDVDDQLRAIGTDGSSHPRLYAIGPITRGSFWEIVAVPDLRMQTWRLARALSNAHWVEGEGL